MQRRVTSGVSRISARGVLMVRLDTKSEGGGGGCMLQLIYCYLLRLKYDTKV